VRDLERLIKSKRLFKYGSCCFQCFLPNIICFNREIKSNKCIYQGYALEIIIFIYKLKDSKYNNLIKVNYNNFFDFKSLLDLASNITISSTFYKCDIIEAIKYIINFNINDYITNLNNNQNRNLFIKDNSALLSPQELFNLTLTQEELNTYNNSILNINNNNNLDIIDEYNTDIELEDYLLILDKEELEQTKINNILNNYKKVINKLEYYNNICLFCFYNNLDNYKHSTFECEFNENTLDYIKNELSIKTNILYNKKINNPNLINTFIKAESLCPECLFPSTICQYYKFNYLNKKDKYKKCKLSLITLTLIYIIFKNKKSKEIPFQLYQIIDPINNSIWDFISNKAPSYFNIKETSKAFLIIMTFKSNSQDKILENY
jgi:hypothetical protein